MLFIHLDVTVLLFIIVLLFMLVDWTERRYWVNFRNFIIISCYCICYFILWLYYCNSVIRGLFLCLYRSWILSLNVWALSKVNILRKVSQKKGAACHIVMTCLNIYILFLMLQYLLKNWPHQLVYTIFLFSMRSWNFPQAYTIFWLTYRGK